MLLVVDALHVNGAVKITAELARRWAGHGARLVAVKRLRDGDAMPLPPGARATTLARADRIGGTAAVPASLRLVRLAGRSDAVVVGSEIGIGLLLGWAAARLTRRPLVIGVHADLDDALQEWVAPRRRRLLRAVHRRADLVICVEEELVGAVLRNGVDPARVAVVPNGVDVAAVRRAAAGPDPLPDVRGPIVVATGRLAPQKATDLLIRAHARIVAGVPHTVLLLNDGPDEPGLHALASELGVEDSVVFAGRVPPHPVVARADAFCLPSRHEGLPLALLEAMALATPTIAADCSAGVRAALDHGRAGRLVPVGDVDALATALRDHLGDQRPLRAAAQHGLEHLAAFDSEAMADGWAAAVRRVTRPAG